MIHQLTPDLIAIVGASQDFDPKDYASSRLASKCLRPITMGCTTHQFLITPESLEVKLENLHNEIRTVIAMKPLLKELRFYFRYIHKNVTIDQLVWETIPKPVELVFRFECCSGFDSCMLQQIPKGSTIEYISGHGTVPMRYMDGFHLRSITFNNDFNNDPGNTLLRDPVVCNTEDVRIVSDVCTISLDLSSINTTNNKSLCVLFVGSDFTCIDPYKLTLIADWRPAIKDIPAISQKQKFYKSCVECESFSERSRLQKISILDNISLVDSVWLRMADIVPKTVSYDVVASSPDIFAFIDGVRAKGITKFNYLYYDDQSYLTAKLCQYCMPKRYKFPIIKTKAEVQVSTHLCNLDSIMDIFNSLNVENQQKWHILTLM